MDIMENTEKKVEKILIVDSNIDYAKFIQNFLKQDGYLCYIALSYEEAINITYEKIPDCILVDYMLPCGGAFEISKHIKSDNLLKNITVLFLTATENKNYCLKSFESGADGFFIKSTDTDIFLAKMKSYIRLKKSIESNNSHMDLLKKDIENAAKLQNTILNYGNTTIPKNELITHRYAPNDVSGDFIGIKKLDDDHYGIILLDVSGHGIAASMLTILIKAFFETHSTKYNKAIAPSKFLEALNEYFISENFDKNMFASIFYAVYNNMTGDLICSSAGSPTPYYYNNNSMKLCPIEMDGPLIGMIEDIKYNDINIKLSNNDVLFIFTDGCYEVFDSENKMFGEEKLKEVFMKKIKKDVNIIKKSIIKELKEFSSNNLNDDMSMIIMRRTI